MGILILALLILIYASAISLKFNRSLEKNIFVSISIIVLFVYFLGLINFLKYSPYILVLIGVLSMGYILWNFKIYNDKCKLLLMRPILIYFVLSLIAVYIFSKDYFISNWDEFSHWGIYVKNMFVFDSLQNINFTDTSGYPPFVSIIQYITMKFNGTYSEPNLIAPLLLISFLAFSSFIRKRNMEKVYQFLFMIIVMFLPTIFFKDYLTSIYVDAILGILLGITVLDILIEKVSIFKLTKIAIYLVSQVLIKDFAIVCVGIVYFILFLEMFFFRKDEYWRLYTSRIRKNIGLKVYMIILFVIPIIVFCSWRLYLAQFSSVQSNVSKMGFSIPNYLMSVINSFVLLTTQNGISTGSNILFVPTFSYFIIAVIMAGYFSFQIKETEKKISKLLFFSLVIVFVFYCLGLILSYVFIFSEDEALKLASYGRYILTVLIGLYIIIFGFSNENSINNNFINYKPLFLSCAIILLFIDTGSIYTSTIGFFQRNNNKIDFATNYYTKLDVIEEKTNENDHVFYVNMESDGYHYYIARYYLTPIHLQNQMWNMKENLNDKSIMEKEKFALLLANYDYVYIDTLNDEFIFEYSDFFREEIKNQSLYKVDKDSELSLSLIE